VGITAHNEEANIGRLLQQVLEQRLDKVSLEEIIVVASGCTDQTVPIAASFADREPRIQLLVQERREGKASAINLFMRQATRNILVLCSADLQLEPDSVERLTAPLADPELGMTSCRPVPVNDPTTFMGFGVHLLWELHHQINLHGFKAGEMTAFRKIFERIPYDTAVDEASVEPIIRGQGYRVRYVPEAIVHNKGAETVADFLRQRRRIYAGHLAVRQSLGYAVSTMSGVKILRLLLSHLDWRPRALLWTAGIVALEMYGRYLGWLDFRRRRDHSVWEIATTTKELKTG
jgi:cellulose synthase/poly-beta-1,6-N-acetylglucosamine synthase-like glycosyltransferase